jgi:hypothetical protein
MSITLSLISTLYKSPHAKSSQFAFTARFLVTDLNNESSPASMFMSLLSSEYPATELNQQAWGPRLYNLRVNPTENTASISFSIVVMGGCLAIAHISLMCLLAATKQRMFLLTVIA